MKIKYFAWLKNITKKDSENITNKKIRDIKTLKQYLCSKYPELEKYMTEENNIRIAVNLKYTLKNKKISPKDEIAIFPPVSGG